MKPTGKLKFAYETITNMESTIEELKAKVERLESWKKKWTDVPMEDAKQMVSSLMLDEMDSLEFAQFHLESMDWKLAMVTMVSYMAEFSDKFMERLNEITQSKEK